MLSLSEIVKKFFNRTTARTTGWADLFKTIGALFVLAAAITGVVYLSGLVTLTLASALTLYAATILIISAVATFNYFFAAQFMRASLSASLPCEAGKRYAKDDTQSDIVQMAHDLITIANAKNLNVQLPTDMPVYMFKDAHAIKIISVYGVIKKASAIFIPSGVSSAEPEELTKMELAALMMVEIIKIRNAHERRGFVNAIGNMGLSFAALLDDLDHSSWFLGRLIATIGSPFQLVLLFQKSRNRTYHYEAMEQVITECGTEFGEALRDAYFKLGLPWENRDPTTGRFVAPQKRPPSPNDGFFQRVYNELAETVYVILKGNKEVFSDVPAAGNIQKFLDESLTKHAGIALKPALQQFRPQPPAAAPAPVAQVAAPVPPVVQAPAPAPVLVQAPTAGNQAAAANDAAGFQQGQPPQLPGMTSFS